METWGVRSIRNALAAWKPALAVVGIAASLACAGGAPDRRSGQADDARAAQLEAVLSRARNAQTAERYDEAAAAYAEATALDRHVAELWANRGLMEYFAHRYAESDKSLLEAILTKPALVSPYLFAGLDELELGRLDVAVQHLEHARALNPRDAQTQAALDRAYDGLDQARPAAAAYAAAAELDAGNKSFWYDLGAASIAVIEQDGGTLARHSPDGIWARALYADELLQQGRTREADETYGRIARLASPADRATLKTTVEYAQHASESRGGAVAQAAWEHIISLLASDAPLPKCFAETKDPARELPRPAGAPATATAQHQRMACLYWVNEISATAVAAQGRLAVAPADAEALFWSVKANERRAVVALAHFEELAPQSAATYDLLGDLYRRRAQPDTALEQYAKALVIAPRDPGALLGRAAALLAIGRMDDARTAAEDALKDAPNDPNLNLLLSEALVDQHHFGEAEPHLRAALEALDRTGAANPLKAAETAHAHALLGRAEAEAGETEQAIADMTLGLGSDRDGSLHFQLSRLLRRTGNFPEARKAEEQARGLQAQRREGATTAVREAAEPASSP